MIGMRNQFTARDGNTYLRDPEDGSPDGLDLLIDPDRVDEAKALYARVKSTTPRPWTDIVGVVGLAVGIAMAAAGVALSLFDSPVVLVHGQRTVSLNVPGLILMLVAIVATAVAIPGTRQIADARGYKQPANVAAQALIDARLVAEMYLVDNEDPDGRTPAEFFARSLADCDEMRAEEAQLAHTTS